MTAVDICRRAHLPPGGIYDVLMKATRFGRVTSRWEHVNEAIRPRNRLYRLTPDGKQRAAEMSAPP
ncbi:helix-turn-helix transcriptional regulator [Pseudonocardia acaciae]|uniref:helix-turn-helix transcriptional regulator n=1 Tax=Pseudonocardia acaciae TaxID=551276 RepID=UPI0012ECC211|nr:helix-turn-helix transcriptional regulator [Pseudonocardia acaciae]